MKRISVDFENTAEEWWDAVRAATNRPAPINFLLQTDALDVEVTDIEAEGAIEWAEQLPGWNDGPEYAPTALTVREI